MSHGFQRRPSRSRRRRRQRVLPSRAAVRREAKPPRVTRRGRKASLPSEPTRTGNGPSPAAFLGDGRRRLGPDHLADLELLRSLLRTAIDLESRCDFGESPTGPRTNRAAFLAHFPDLEPELELWDAAVNRVKVATRDLWAWLDDACADRGVREPEFAVGAVIDRLALLVLQRARNWELQSPHKLTFERFAGSQPADPATLYMGGRLVVQVPSLPADAADERVAFAAKLLQQLHDDLAQSQQASEVLNARDLLLLAQESLRERLAIPRHPVENR